MNNFIFTSKSFSLKPSFFVLLLSVYLLFSTNSIFAISWKGTVSSDWSLASNWTTNKIPTSAIDVIIGDANFTGSFQPDLSRSALCKSLTIGNGSIPSTLIIDFPINVYGNIIIGINGNISHTAATTFTVLGNWNKEGIYTSTILNANVSMNGIGSSITGATTFENLTINGTISLNNPIVVGGNFFVYATFIPNSNLVTINRNFILGSVSKLHVKESSFDLNYSKNPTSINGNATINYSSSVLNQEIKSTISYGTLVISGNTTKYLTSNLRSLLSSSNVIGKITVLEGILDLRTFTANRGRSRVGGTFSVANGATVKISANNFPLNFNTNSLEINSSFYYSGDNQTISNQVYGNLILEGQSGNIIKTMVSPLTVSRNLTINNGSASSVIFQAMNNVSISGNLIIGSGTIYQCNIGNIHQFGGSVLNDGIINGAKSAIKLISDVGSLSGSGIYNLNDLIVDNNGGTIQSFVNLELTGNFTSNDELNTNGTVISFIGNLPSRIGGSWSPPIQHLAINKTAATVSLLVDIWDISTVTINSGILDLTDYTLHQASGGSVFVNEFCKMKVGGINSLPIMDNGYDLQLNSTIEYNGMNQIISLERYSKLILNGTGIKTCKAGTINVQQDFIVNGVVVVAEVGNTISFNGADQQMAGIEYYNLNLASAGNKTLSSIANIRGTVSLVDNSTLISNGKLVLISNSTGTARISQLSPIRIIQGNITVQRYIETLPGNVRRYRYLSSPVNINGQINYSQFLDDIYITGQIGSGFDLSNLNKPSAFIYNETVEGTFNFGYEGITSVNNTLATGKGVSILIRGDRSLGSPAFYTQPFPIPTPATIDYTGSVNFGNVTLPLTFTDHPANDNYLDDGWNLVGNPYPSNINWNSTSFIKTNVEDVIYTYNPTTGSFGTYKTSNNASINNGSQIIASGHSFFVKASGAGVPSISLSEQVKTNLDPHTNYIREAKLNQLSVVLVNSEGIEDETLIIFKKGSSLLFNDKEDARKLLGNSLNIYSISSDKKKLAINEIDYINKKQSLNLGAEGAPGFYLLKFIGSNTFNNKTTITLLDKYLNCKTIISTNTLYKFEIIDKDENTGDRFELIFNDNSLVDIKNVLEISNDRLLVSKENPIVQTMRIYPNPAKNVMHINITGMQAGIYQLTVVNNLGKIMISRKTEISELGSNLIEDVSKLASGIYTIQLKNSEQKQPAIIGKLIKQ